MKDLTLLLDKNKYYYSMYLNIKAAMGSMQKEMEEIKADFLFQIEESSLKLGVSRNEVSNLNETLEKFKMEKKDLQFTIDCEKKKNIEGKNQLRKIRNSYSMIEQSTNMLCEELLVWRYMYDLEKIKNQNTTLALEALESRVFRYQK